MDTALIESMIAEKCGDPDAGSDIGELLGVAADRQGRQVSDADLEKGAEFVRRYIELGPYMMKVAWTASSTVGLESPMHQILEAVRSYWLEDEDIIPDQLGIVGLLDDAYCSLTLLQTVSDQYQMQTGKFLFPDDFTSANRVMRKIIGEPYASDLDRMVTSTMQNAGMMEAVKALALDQNPPNRNERYKKRYMSP
jgi:uncharacterized membrane protein YkvA (DUF1232 family)